MRHDPGRRVSAERTSGNGYEPLNMSTTIHHWTALLTCVVSSCSMSAEALAAECGYSPPELQGDFQFWGECIPKASGRHYLRTEIASTQFKTNEVRWAIVYVPATNLPATGTPLILALHGGCHNAATMEADHPELLAAAGEQVVVLAFLNGHGDPDGCGNTWSPFGSGAALLDLNYVEGAILWLQHYLPIDTERTFVTGYSAGAGMTQRFTADRPNRVKAGAAFCYTTGYMVTNNTNHVELPAPVAPISMFLVRGGQDTSVPPDGMTPNDKGLIYDSVADQLDFWVTAAGGTTNELVNAQLDADTTRHTYTAGNILVEMLYNKSLGHLWPTTYDRTVLNWLLSLPAEPCEYSPPELGDDFYFRGECVPNMTGRYVLRTEIGSVQFNTNEVRSIIVRVPTNSPSTGCPLVLALHGRSQGASFMEGIHPNLIDAAREEGVVLAFLEGEKIPDDIGHTWSMFGNGQALLDVAYVEGVILWLQHFLPIDSKRTFVSGFSAGAGMTQRVAADRPHRIKAGAAFCYSTALVTTNGVRVEIPTPQAPIPMFLVRGGRDVKVHPDGNTINDEGYIYDSVRDQLEFWVTAVGGATNQVTSTQVDADTTRYTYAAGTVVVEMFYDRNLAHDWKTEFDRPMLDWFLSLPADATVRLDGANVVVTFSSGTLQSAESVTGTWTDVPGATSPYSIPHSGSMRYFRTRPSRDDQAQTIMFQ